MVLLKVDSSTEAKVPNASSERLKPKEPFPLVSNRIVKPRSNINTLMKNNNPKQREKPMNFNQPPKIKKSLGALRRASKTKTLSPDLTGPMKLQRHTLETFVQQFREIDGDELTCNLAAWNNEDRSGRYFSVELSPRYVSQKVIEQPKSICPFEFMFDNDEQEETIN
jgi:hypothetical protein